MLECSNIGNKKRKSPHLHSNIQTLNNAAVAVKAGVVVLKAGVVVLCESVV